MKRFIKRMINKVMSEVEQDDRGVGPIDPQSMDILIQALFNMLKEEAPDSGALCISLETGGLIVAAESLEHAYNVLEQCHDELNEDLTPGYYGNKIEA